jgi:hypothetical protein
MNTGEKKRCKDGSSDALCAGLRLQGKHRNTGLHSVGFSVGVVQCMFCKPSVLTACRRRCCCCCRAD